MDAQFWLRYEGYQVRIVNRGNALANNIRLSFSSWPLGSPGPWVSDYAVRDVPAHSDEIVPVDIIPRFINDHDRDQIGEQLQHHALSGYFTVTCGQCSESSTWAFNIPPQDSDWERKFYSVPDWPLAKVSDIDRKPHTGQCVDVPFGVCPKLYSEYAWRSVRRPSPF